MPSNLPLRDPLDVASALWRRDVEVRLAALETRSYAFGLRADSNVNTVTAAASAAWQDLGGPSVTVTVGSTGEVFVVGSAYFQSGAAAKWGAWLGVSADGATATYLGGCGAQNASEMTATIAGGVLLEGITPGAHVLDLRYSSALATADLNISYRSIVAWPL